MKKILIFYFLFFASPAFAADGLVSCGLGDGQYCTPCDLWTLASNIVNFIVKDLALPILVLALLIGGVVWATSMGDLKRIELGKKIITSSVIGVFIAFGGWLIVDTIINTLASGSPTFPWQQIEECPAAIPTAPTGGTTSGGITTISKPIGAVFSTEAEGELFLNKANIIVINQSGSNCHVQSDPGCTSVVGLPISTARHLTDLKTTGLNFYIIGGTEAGHKEHGPGQPVVDLVPATPTGSAPRNNTSKEYLELKNKIIGRGGQAHCENSGGATRFPNCDGGTNHVHVVWP